MRAALLAAVPRPHGEVAEIDGLRGLAIFAVMVHRLWPRDAVNRLSVAADAGWIGVDLFFVVSGFLITRILLETRGEPGYFRNFYARRVLRIFPLYYLFVGTLLVVFPLMGNTAYLEQSGSPFWYLTFLGNIPEALLGKDPPYWLAPVWSLAIEEQFYLTFPWIVLWLGPKRLGGFLILLFLFAPAVRLITMNAWPDQERIQYLFTLCRVDAIAAGCMVALIMRWRYAYRLRDLAIVVACCAGAVAVIGNLDRTSDFGRVAGYSFVAIMFGAVLVAVMNGLDQWWTAPLRWGWLRYAGRLCFGLYLLHRPADTITAAIANRFNVDADRISWIPIKIAVALFMASVAWVVIEKPFLRLKRYFVSVRHPSAGAIAGVALVLVAACHVPSFSAAVDAASGGDAAGPTGDAGALTDDGAFDAAVDAAVDAAADAAADAAVAVDAAPAADADVTAPQSEHALYAAGQRHSPITAAVAARLQALGGGDPRVFAKIGDSITDTSNFLACFDGGNVDYGAHAALQPHVSHFLQGRIASASPFVRISEAAQGGWTAADLLEGTPCGLDRELAAATPNLGIMLLGTNDNRYGRTLDGFILDLWTATDRLLATGTIPILSTLPPMRSYPEADARVPLFNLAIRALAQGRQVPLVDLHGALATLPGDGIAADGLHPTVAPGGACILTSAGLEYGYNTRNLMTIEALARVQRALAGVASDGSAPIRTGTGTAADPYRLGWPLIDLGDVREASISSACGSSAPGVVYALANGGPATIEARVIGNAQTIDVVAAGGCVASGGPVLTAALPGGASRIIVRGTGEFILLVR